MGSTVVVTAVVKNTTETALEKAVVTFESKAPLRLNSAQNSVTLKDNVISWKMYAKLVVKEVIVGFLKISLDHRWRRVPVWNETFPSTLTKRCPSTWSEPATTTYRQTWRAIRCKERTARFWSRSLTRQRARRNTFGFSKIVKSAIRKLLKLCLFNKINKFAAENPSRYY